MMKTEHRVAFADTVTVIECNRQTVDRLQWISAFRLHKISSQMVSLADNYSRDERTCGLGVLLDKSSQDRTHFLVTLNSDMEDVRGLEFLICSKQRNQLAYAKEETKRAVLDLQQQVKSSGQGSASLQEALAVASSEASLDAKIYARELAIADQRVAKDILQQDEQNGNLRQWHASTLNASAKTGLMGKLRIVSRLRRLCSKELFTRSKIPTCTAAAGRSLFSQK